MALHLRWWRPHSVVVVTMSWHHAPPRPSSMAPVVSRAPRKPQFAFDRPQHTAERVATADLELSVNQSMQRMYPAIVILLLAMAASDVHWFHHNDESHQELHEVRLR